MTTTDSFETFRGPPTSNLVWGRVAAVLSANCDLTPIATTVISWFATTVIFR